MAITGMPITRQGLPDLPASQTSDLSTPTNELSDVIRQPGHIPQTAVADRQYHQLLQGLLTLLQHPLFKQLMQMGQAVKPQEPQKFDFHVGTGSVPLERYPLPQPEPRLTTRQGQ